MEYIEDATIRFKGDCNLQEVDERIREDLVLLRGYRKKDISGYSLEIPEKGRLNVILDRRFEFYDVEILVRAVLSAGLKKFGRDKLIAYQSCAGCYFKNYVTKDGKFLDFCGDVIY